MLQIYPECKIMKDSFNGNCWLCAMTDMCAANKVLGCTLEESHKVLGINDNEKEGD